MFDIENEANQLVSKLRETFDEIYSDLPEDQKRLFENFDLNKILNSLLTQLNKISDIDSLLYGLKNVDINSVLEHPNVRKLVKELTVKSDFVNKLDGWVKQYDVKEFIGQTLSAGWLKGWTVMNLLTDANLLRMVENLNRIYEIESVVDKVSGFLAMANFFIRLNLDSVLDSLNTDDILKQISEVNLDQVQANIRDRASRVKSKPSGGQRAKNTDSSRIQFF
jgi:hypothetical protein